MSIRILPPERHGANHAPPNRNAHLRRKSPNPPPRRIHILPINLTRVHRRPPRRPRLFSRSALESGDALEGLAAVCVEAGR